MKLYLSLFAALIVMMGAAAAYAQTDGGSETAKQLTPKSRARTLDLRAYGILMDQSLVHYDKTSIANSLLCHNVISHTGFAYSATNGETGGGILTRYWNGYEKKNEVSHSANGSVFDVSNSGKYFLGYYHHNNGPGINNTCDYTTSPAVEMRGLIHPGNVGDYAGFNAVDSNNLDNSSSSAEVVVGPNVIFAVGNISGTGSPSVTYGENSFAENSGTDLLFYSSGSPFPGEIGGVNYDAFNADYLEVGGVSYSPPCNSPAIVNVQVNNGCPSSAVLTAEPSRPFITCYGASERAKGEKLIPASSMNGSDTLSRDECSRMFNFLEFNTDAQAEYDTGKAFLTLCDDGVLPHIESAFIYTEDGADNRNNDPNRFAEYREWLKSVLYLRQDTGWYCGDVYQILHTFVYYPGHGIYDAGAEAVVRYILDHQRCDSLWTNEWFKKANSDWPINILTRWRDTVQDSIIYDTIKNSLGMDTIIDSILQPDTTVPSIDSIGLSILRGAPASVRLVQLASGTSEITGLSATENPFTNATEIKFDLADYGLVTFQLYDLLGNAVTTNGIGQVLYPGEHSFEVDGSKLATGTYIARVAFHDGDVESIMVVKK